MKLLLSPPSLRNTERERKRGRDKRGSFFPFCRTLFVAHATLEGFIGAGLPVDLLSSSRDNRARNSGKFWIISLFFCVTVLL